MSNKLWIRAGIATFCCVAIVGAAVATSNISRASLRTVEKLADFSLENMFKEDRAVLLGSTRGVYLQGYGVVFSAEVEVSPGTTPNPFRPPFTKEEVAKIKERKRARLAQLRDHMRNMMVEYAGSVDIPMNENIALAVIIPYSKVEDAEGLPSQIVMSAPRQALKSGNSAALSSTLKVQEFF